MQYKILICDDNEVVHESLKIYLEKDGIDSVSVYDGESALSLVKSQKFDLVILDIMLPKIFGTDVCREIRKFSDVPIIFLSAKGEETDRIIGLELGADDYVTKPFSPREVSVRVKSVLRRFRSKSDDTDSPLLTLGNLSINPKAYEVRVQNKVIKMTPREVELLTYLVLNAGEVLTRDDILNKIWGEDYYGDTRAVDTLLARVRGKIHEHTSGVKFRSVYGVGYMVEDRHDL